MDIDRDVTRTMLDALNHMASQLPAGYRVNQTPVRSFATAPYRKRVTLVVELPFEPPNLWDVIATIWCGLFRSVRWGTNQIIVGPLALYERIVTHSLLLVTSESLDYSTDKSVWSHIAGGVPVSSTKVLWKLEAQTDRDSFIFALEDFNEHTAGAKQSVLEVRAYDREADSMIPIWRKQSERSERGPRDNPLDLSIQYYDMYLKIPNYSYSDYMPFLEHVFYPINHQTQ